MTTKYHCTAVGPFEPGVIEEVVEILHEDDKEESSSLEAIAQRFLREHFSRDPKAWAGIEKVEVVIRCDGPESLFKWTVTLEPMVAVDFEPLNMRARRYDTRGILLMDNERALPGFVEVQCDDELAGQPNYPDSDEAAALRLVALAATDGCAFWQTPEGSLVPFTSPDCENPPGFCVVMRNDALVVFNEEEVP